MKKKIGALVLAACLLLLLVPSGGTLAQAAGLNFISINDTLINNAYAHYSGSSVYVPATLFAYFGVYYSYFQQEKTASLVTDSTQIYFELESGNTYDAAENYYSAQAYSINGVVYVPVGFVCRMFGLSWSTITDSVYGSIVRIKSGSVVLSDEQFLSAASESMKTMYNSYYGLAQPSPSVSDDPTATVEPPPEPDRSDTAVYLCFAGLPEEELVKELTSRRYRAAFFLTAEQAEQNADAVRALVVDGFAVGVWFEGAEEYDRAYSAILKSTRQATLLVACGEELAAECSAFAQERSLAMWQCGISAQPKEEGERISSPAQFIAQLETAEARADVLIDLERTETAAAASVITYLALNKYTVAAVRETTAPEVEQ